MIHVPSAYIVLGAVFMFCGGVFIGWCMGMACK